jgi:TRAP-type transport system periplasmic protein
MKQRIFVAVAITVFLGVVFISANSSFAQSTKPIELKFSTFLSMQHQCQVNVYAPFAKELEERSKGRVKVSFFPSEALGKAKDHYDLAVRGIADIAMFVPGYTPGRFPLSSVFELPINIPSGEMASRACWELFEKYFKQEYQGVKVLQLYVFDPNQINTTKKPVKTFADLKGLRLRASGPVPQAVLRAWGVSPLTIPVPDLYDSMQKGMADGAFLNFSGVEDFKLGDLFKYRTVAHPMSILGGIVMNPDSFNKLPADVQKIIDEITGLKISVKQGAVCDNTAKMGLEAARKAGVQIYDLPAAERAIWMEKVKPVNDAWIADTEKKGLPGKKVFEEAVSLVQKYSKK